MTYNDFIIPLAWPEAPVRTAGGPYDKVLIKVLIRLLIGSYKSLNRSLNRVLIES